MGVRGACSGDNLGAAGSGFAIGDVVGDSAEKQERFLQHQADIAPVVGHRQRADIHAVEQNRAFAEVVKAADQVHQRALAGTAVADQADHLARRDVQIQAAYHGTVAVTETRFAQCQRAADVIQMDRLGGLRHAGDVVEHVENALGPSGGFLRHRDNPAHRIEPSVKAPDVSQKRRQHADRDLVVCYLPDAECPHHQQADFGE